VKYTLILFKAWDDLGDYEYSFKLNLAARELSVEYKNNQGGFTTNGICLGEEAYRRFCRLLEVNDYEKYRDASLLQKAPAPSLHMVMDGGGPGRPPWSEPWHALFYRADGLPPLELESEYPPPGCIRHLANYAMNIGRPAGAGWRFRDPCQ